MQSGDLIDLDVTGVAHGGVFVARHDGRVVFVPDAIPGERVRARLTDTSKSSFWRAETIEVLDASPHRRAHVWRQADLDTPPEHRPGGADFGHIDLNRQRELKLEVLTDALQRFAGLELPVSIRAAEADIAAPAAEPDSRATATAADSTARTAATDSAAVETDDGTGWRTRVSLHVDEDGNIGPYAARSHRIIPVDALPLATPAVARAALRLAQGRPGRIDLVQPADGRVRVLPRPESARPGGRRRGRAAAPLTRDDPAREVVVETVGGRDFRVDAGGFWQVHRLAAPSLTRLVARSLEGAVDPDAWHLDLYGGVGLFAATLATLGGPSTRVTSVESDARATEHAGENLSEWIGARAETARVDRWITQLGGAASAIERDRLGRGVVLLDPPRSGAGRAVVEGIAGFAPETVVYVACDPVALARDLGTFRAAGYETRSVEALDLFPNSHHVEAIATLSRVDPLP